MKWITAIALTLSLVTGCRVERSWESPIDMAPGELREDVWFATDAGQFAQDTEASGCTSALVSSDPGLTVTVLDDDTWAGHCWVRMNLTLGSDVTEPQDATFEFIYDLCRIDGGECPADLTNQRQERTLRVRPL